jgi:hypothetical protein
LPQCSQNTITVQAAPRGRRRGIAGLRSHRRSGRFPRRLGPP